MEIQNDDIIISCSVELMKRFVEVPDQMREKSVEIWIDETSPIAQKLEIEPDLKSMNPFLAYC